MAATHTTQPGSARAKPWVFAGLLSLFITSACGGEQGEPADPRAQAADLEPAAEQRLRELTLALPERIQERPAEFFDWVSRELLPGAGAYHADRLLWRALSRGSGSERLGKIWLALESIGRPPGREAFFKRCRRPLEDLPEVKFVAVPAGSFLMGSPEGEAGRSDAEGPVREVSVAAFQLAATTVTNAQFEKFDPFHARQDWAAASSSELDDHPVVNVSWWDAFVFSRWMGARLPSEAEWEYACRAGSTSRYWSGDGSPDLERVGWIFGNAGERTHEVAALPANPWGLHDTHGNVFEWCQDTWHADQVGAPTHSRPRTDLAAPFRVYRGGAWNRFAEYSRAAFRAGWPPGERNHHLGFRLARDG